MNKQKNSKSNSQTRSSSKKSLSTEERKADEIYTSNLKKLQNVADKIENEDLFVFFKPSNLDMDAYICQVCTNLKVTHKNLKRHITKVDAHKLAIKGPEKEEQHKGLVKSILEYKEKKKNKNSIERQKSAFIKFIVGCAKAKCSFSQISLIGNLLRDIHKHDTLAFLKEFAFDTEKISHVINCYGHYLKRRVTKRPKLK